MTTTEEVLTALVGATDQAKDRALRILRGEQVNTDPFLSMRAVSEKTGFSTATLYRWGIPSHEIAGRPRYRLSEVLEYLNSDTLKERAKTLKRKYAEDNRKYAALRDKRERGAA